MADILTIHRTVALVQDLGLLPSFPGALCRRYAFR